jgi:DNA-binding CsgD family transcriptional regulator
MEVMQRCIHVALIDSCEYTKIGLSQLMLLAKNDNIKLNITSFSNISAFSKSNSLYDVIIYDPLNSIEIIINIERSVSAIRQRNPHCKIFLFSMAIGFLKQSQVEGMFTKRIELDDLNSLWDIIINKFAKLESYFNVNLTTVGTCEFSLSNSEISVLRGYSANLKTKQIANHMGCDIKKIYYYKKTAIDKLENLRSSFFYNGARCFLN